MKIKSRYLFFVLFFLLFSCTFQSRKAKELLTQVDSIMVDHPDSALALLESLDYPSELPKSLYADYVLLYVQTKDMLFKDISNDTLIVQVKDYLREKRNMKKEALAAFFSGRVYQSRKKYDQAMQAYLEAEKMAQKLPDDNLKGLIQYFIGELHYDQQSYFEAIEKFKFAGDYFEKSAAKYQRKIIVFTLIGNSFFIENERDSAFSYFDKALALAQLHNDSNQVALVTQNRGVLFLGIDETRQAKDQLFQALALTANPDMKTKIHLNLAKTYEKENRIDSALYYANVALQLQNQEEDKFTRLSIYILLSQLEEKSGDYIGALSNHQQYSHLYDQIRDEKETVNLLEIQKKYDFELMQGINNRLIIQIQWILLYLFLLVIGIIVILFVFYRKNQQHKEALSHAQQAVYQLKEMVNHADNNIHAFLVRQFDVVKKVSLLEGYLRKEEQEKGKEVLKKVNKIIYEKDSFDWGVLYQVMNKLHKGYFDRIREVFPDLSELEYQICCLTKSELNNTEIAIILKSNVNIIQMKKTAIRKKLGITGYGDIAAFMDEMMDEPAKKPV